MSKEDKVKFLKEITKASSVTNVCRDLNIDIGNVTNGKTKEAKIDLVIEELVKRIEKTLKKYGK